MNRLRTLFASAAAVVALAACTPLQPAVTDSLSTTSSVARTATTQTLGPGGVATPAGALSLPAVSGGKSSITKSGVYDCKGATVNGWINIKATRVTVQNCVVNASYNYGIYSDGSDNVIQNNEIKNLHGPGDINVITYFGDRTLIGYNVAVNAVSNPGGSHTDFVQTWVSDSHKIASDDVLIIGNRAIGPNNADRDNSIPSIHQFYMVEDYKRGGNSGGNTDGMRNHRITGNEIGASWGQDIKNDGVDGMIVDNNNFVGSSDHAMQQASGSGLKFFESNQVGPDYGNAGVPITAGAGPA